MNVKNNAMLESKLEDIGAHQFTDPKVFGCMSAVDRNIRHCIDIDDCTTTLQFSYLSFVPGRRYFSLVIFEIKHIQCALGKSWIPEIEK